MRGVCAFTLPPKRWCDVAFYTRLHTRRSVCYLRCWATPSTAARILVWADERATRSRSSGRVGACLPRYLPYLPYPCC